MQINQSKYTPNFNGINIVQVDNKLSRGCSTISFSDIKKMKKVGITQIIDLRNSASFAGPVEKFICKKLGINYINYKFSHRQNTIPDKDFFEKINNSIISNQGKTYIHCQYGKHRTGLAVAIYEKLFAKKSDSQIFQSMIDNGYKEIISEGKTNKEKKYIGLYQQMIDRYF